MDLDVLGLIAVFFTALIATTLSSMSGAGSEMIMFPVFISLGMPIPLVISTAFTSNFLWLLPAAYNYLKERVVDWRFVIGFSGVGLIGAYFGISFVENIDQRVYNTIIGVIIIGLAIYTYFSKDLGLTEHRTHSKTRQMVIYPFGLLLGFYETVLGAGNAMVLSLLTFYTKGFDFIDALGHYYLIIFPWSVFVATILITRGYFDLKIVVVATLGCFVGGYFGSRYARYKGNKFIKTLFVIIGGILGLKLLFGL